MIKRFLTIILCGIVLFCFTACNKENNSITYDTLFDTYPSVFVTDNITRITFYAYYGAGKGSEVPKKYMTEIINWLDSFTINREANDEDVPPGTNNYNVEIEYSDGTIIKEGLDIIINNNKSYLLEKDNYPDCFRDIISKTSLD